MFFACACVGYPLVAASEGPTPANPIKLEIGLLGLSDLHGAKEWFSNEIKSFMEANPAVVVDVSSTGMSTRENDEIEQCVSLPRNIIGISSLPGYEVAYLVRSNAIVPIDQFLPDPEFSADAFYENMWEPVTFAAKRWGVPWATTLPILLWSPSLFKKAGVETPPATWKEFMECARLLTKDFDGDGMADQVGCAPLKPGTLGILCAQCAVENAIPMMTEKGYSLYTEEMDEVLRLMKQLHALSDEVNAKSNLKAPYAMGFTLTGDDIDPALGQFAVAPLPSDRQPRRLVDLGRLYLAVRKSTPEEEAASWEFIKWISRKDVGLPGGVFGYPARRDIVEREDFVERSKEWFQDSWVPWEENQWLTSFGSTNVVGRYAGLQRLVVSVQMGLLPSSEARTKWNAAAIDLNSQLRLLKPVEERQYELFK